MASIKEAIKKTYLCSMEQWEPCCNATISPKRISWRTFQRLSAFLKREQRFIVLTQPQAIKAVHAAYFEAVQISLKPILFKHYRHGRLSSRRHRLRTELRIGKIAREVADEFTSKTQINRFVAGSVGPTNRTASMFQM
jgi:5-methyltetrahydrofolate--homocysteine methyltransferase